jgi:hypothetical protein
MQRYDVYGLRVDSAIALDGFRELHSQGAADVVVDEGAVAASRPADSSTLAPSLEIDADGSSRILVPGLVRFRIEVGRRIVVDALPGADPRAVVAHLVGSVFGAILIERGTLPLHASAVRTTAQGKCVAFAGRAAAGKSTLVGFLAERGFDVVTDDLCAVRIGGAGSPLVDPGPPRLKLDGDSIRKLGLPTRGLRRAAGAKEKYLWPIPGVPSDVASLAAIVFLEPREAAFADRGPEIRAISRACAIGRVAASTYRRSIVDRLDLSQWHFSTCAEVVRRVPAYELDYDRSWDGLSGLVDRVVDTFLVS